MSGRWLHVTSGDVTADLLRASGIGGDVLAWRDILHEGPVPRGLSLEELSEVRVRFLASCAWGLDLTALRAEFRQRDATLQGFRTHDEVVFWFEADLCDQLQLAQILGWLARRDRGSTGLSLVPLGAGREPLAAPQLADLFPTRVLLGPAVLDVGQRVWEALVLDSPLALAALGADETAPLPFLRSAIGRLLEQYPSTEDGLSRSERQILESVAHGVVALGPLFQRSQIDLEARPFAGDWTFLLWVRDLCLGAEPLLACADGGPLLGAGAVPAAGDGFWQRELRLTDAGTRVLARRADRVELAGIDRWLGGVHLVGRNARWRYSPRARRMVARG